MKKIALILGGILLSASALAEDGSVSMENGKRLYEKNPDKCLSCHKNGEYFKGKDRTEQKQKTTPTNMDELESWVRNCDIRFETNWYDQDVLDVVAYLNQKYYQFPITVASNTESLEEQENIEISPAVSQDDEAQK